MQRLGFIHDMMDVKVLILFVMARVNYPVDRQQIYELCFQDECLSYFDVCTAIPQMVESGHLEELPGAEQTPPKAENVYVITEKGKADGALTADSIVYTVRQKAENAVARFNRQIRRSSRVKTQIIPRESGDVALITTLNDELSTLMTLELVAPNQRQAVRLGRLMEKKADTVYNLIMMELLDEEEDLES